MSASRPAAVWPVVVYAGGALAALGGIVLLNVAIDAGVTAVKGARRSRKRQRVTEKGKTAEGGELDARNASGVSNDCIDNTISASRHGDVKVDGRQHSAIYTGRVWHTRFLPLRHAFTYPIFFVMLDLDHLDEAMPWYLWPFMSHRLPAVVRFDDGDHLKDQPACQERAGGRGRGRWLWGKRNTRRALADRVRDLVELRTGTRPTGRICLLTHLKYLGYCFNPVSFYYVFSEKSDEIESVVGEVSNTPWGEMHCYVLNEKSTDSGMVRLQSEAERESEREVNSETDKVTGTLRYRFEKAFHVSPFMAMDHVYDWSFSLPGEAVGDTVTVGNSMYTIGGSHPSECNGSGSGCSQSDGDSRAANDASEQRKQQLAFHAKLVMERRPFAAHVLLREMLMLPCLCFVIQVWIHYEAFKLWRKEVTFFPHPKGSQTFFSRAVARVMIQYELCRRWQMNK